MAFKAVQTYDRKLLKTVLDTTEALILDEEEYYDFQHFRQKLLENFKDTKPAKLRGLSHKGIGVMESQHRQVTYRMKHRGMYWSIKGACAMAKLILLERIDQLEELFFGDWRKDYQYYHTKRLGVGPLGDNAINNPFPSQKILKQVGKYIGYDRQQYKY